MSDQPINVRAAALLRALADECEKNDAERFGGCFFIMPPEGDPKDMLLLNRQASAAMYWGNLKSTADIALAELAEKERLGQSGFGRR